MLPLLVLLTFGILAFGHAFHVQTVLDNAARDAVRVYVLHGGTQAQAVTAATAVALDSVDSAVLLPAVDVNFPPSCPLGTNARVTIAADGVALLGGYFGSINLEGSGTMRCNG